MANALSAAPMPMTVTTARIAFRTALTLEGGFMIFISVDAVTDNTHKKTGEDCENMGQS
ncbi:hypothetical protein At12D13_46620 (plasmid) [Agrobacterium fabrum]|nr:hypothetical protein At12D13_46620 [Agrobacterium fabrum]